MSFEACLVCDRDITNEGQAHLCANCAASLLFQGERERVIQAAARIVERWKKGRFGGQRADVRERQLEEAFDALVAAMTAQTRAQSPAGKGGERGA